MIYLCLGNNYQLLDLSKITIHFGRTSGIIKIYLAIWLKKYLKGLTGFDLHPEPFLNPPALKSTSHLSHSTIYNQ
jgi:hypothetical protein